MYRAPRELLQPGRSYPDFLRYLAENGYYGEGEVDALVAKRVESLRNPTGKSFEDHTPDGRWYRIRRRPAAAGGTVTVMTDITEQKQAERELLEAKQRTEEANKLITEKNRMLEALFSEIQDKNRQVEEQAAQTRRMECEARNARCRAGLADRAVFQAHAIPLAENQRPDHVRRCGRLAEDAPLGDHGGVRRPARLHRIYRDARSRKR